MFCDNLKNIRKAKGFSQEELAIHLHVVRQTISKWEKGLSVPDADMLIKIAETFEVSISELLGMPFDNKQDVNAIANQLSRINEQLAIKNRRSRWIWRIIIGLFLAFVIFHIFLYVVASVSLDSYQNKTTTHIEKISE